MTFDEFNKHQAQLLGSIKAMGELKGREYVNGDADRFANFNRLAQRLNIPRTKVLMVYLTKHLDAIENFINTGRGGAESIDGRILDALVYLTLLDGMIAEDSSSHAVGCYLGFNHKGPCQRAAQ